MIGVNEAKAYIEANYQGDPLLRHMFITLLDKLPKVEQKDLHRGNQIPYENRVEVYTHALFTYGLQAQMVVAMEELSECQKEICKHLRGLGNAANMAEEIADATIMLEQLRYFLGLNELVCKKMDEKIQRLDDRLTWSACEEVNHGEG